MAIWVIASPPNPHIPCWLEFTWFGTQVGWREISNLKIRIMTPNAERAQKLMNAATRLMVAGDVQRYLHALRLLFAMRTRTVRLA